MCKLLSMFSKLSGIWLGRSGGEKPPIQQPPVQPSSTGQPPRRQAPVHRQQASVQPPPPTITINQLTNQPEQRQEKDMNTGSDRIVRQLVSPPYEGIFGRNAYENRIHSNSNVHNVPLYLTEPLVSGNRQLQINGPTLAPPADLYHLTPHREGPISTPTSAWSPAFYTPARSPRTPFIIKPPKFRGEPGKLEEFLIEFDMCCEANEWTEVEKLRYLKTSLIGSATFLLRRESTNLQKERYTFDSLITALKNEYRSKLSCEQWLSKLMQIRQSSTQTVSECKNCPYPTKL